jgi:phospholipid transport system transporter-binding protein
VITIELTIKEGTLFINGELSRYSLALISNTNYSSYFERSEIVIDLSQVTKVDTAGLAWMFYLIEHATSLNCQLSFTHLPIKLDKLITLSGVDGLLPVVTSE